MEKKQKTQPDCRTCIYRAGNGSPNRCDYAMINRPHTRMAQPPEKCTYYIKGERLELSPQERVDLLDQPGVGERISKGRKYDWDLAMKLHKEGKASREIAAALQCNVKRVYEWKYRNNLEKSGGGRPQMYDWDLGRRLWEQGKSDREIMEAVGCQKPMTVYAWRKREGLAANPTNSRKRKKGTT